MQKIKQLCHLKGPSDLSQGYISKKKSLMAYSTLFPDAIYSRSPININKSYLTETWCESINPTKISKVGGPCFCGPIENDKNETHRRNISALNERDDDLNKSEKIYNDIQIHIWFVFNFGCFFEKISWRFKLHHRQEARMVGVLAYVMMN